MSEILFQDQNQQMMVDLAVEDMVNIIHPLGQVTHHLLVHLKVILEEQVTLQDQLMDLVVEVELVELVEMVVHHQEETVELVHQIQ